MGDSVPVIDLRANAKLRASVDHEERRIFLTLLGNGGHDVVVLALSEGGAEALLGEVEDLLPELTGEPRQCRECAGTGDLWIPMAPGAVRKTRCACEAGRASADAARAACDAWSGSVV